MRRSAPSAPIRRASSSASARRSGCISVGAAPAGASRAPARRGRAPARSTSARSSESRPRRVARDFCRFSSSLSCPRPPAGRGHARPAGADAEAGLQRLGLGAVQRRRSPRRPPPWRRRPGRRRRRGRRPATPATAGRRAPPCGPAGPPRRGPAGGPGRRGPGRPPRTRRPAPGRRRPGGPARRRSPSTGGVRSATTRQRERMVTGTSSGCRLGAQSRKTVRGGGSSIILSTALDAVSVIRSASSTSDRPASAPGTARGRRPGPARAPRRRRSTALGDDDVHVGVGAGQHGPARVAGAVAAVGALQRGGEGAGGDRPAGAGRAGEQPGVGHRGRVGDGRPQLGDDRRLADHLRPDALGRRHGGRVTGAAGGSGRSGRAGGAAPRRRARHRRPAVAGAGCCASCLQRQAGEQLGDPDPDRRGDLVGRLRRVEDQVAVGSASASARKVCRTRWWKSSDSASSRSATARPRARARPDLRRQVEQHGQVGLEPLRSPSGTASGRRRAGWSGRRPGRPASCRRTGR